MAVLEISNKLFFANVRHIISSGNPVELRVKGTSMHPVLQDGKHKVVLVPYQRQYLRIGIIALFVYKEKHILHRLVSTKGDWLIFQGDNLPYVKEYVREEDIIAVAEFIITPTGKTIDCKTRWFFIKNKLRRPVYQYRLILMSKIKNLYVKVISNRRLKIV